MLARIAFVALLLAAPARAEEAPDGGTPPAAKGPTIIYLTREQLEHPPPSLPDWFKNKHPRSLLIGMYTTCLDVTGHVSTTKVTKSLGDAKVDQSVMDQIKKGWTYKPQPVPVCFFARLAFKID